MSMHNVYRERLPRHSHNWSDTRYFDMKQGQLVPCYLHEMYPGDKVKISSRVNIETRTLNSPLKSGIKFRQYFFFVPRRLMWKNWEKFIFGGKDGNFTADYPYIKPPLSLVNSFDGSYNLFRYYGFPQLDVTEGNTQEVLDWFERVKIDAMPFAAYQMIWKDWFRNENFSSDVWDFENSGNSWLKDGSNELGTNGDTGNEVIFLGALHAVPWSRTYFTAALPFRQRGNANRVPLSGTAALKMQDLSTGELSNARYYRIQNSGSQTADANNITFMAGTENVTKSFVLGPMNTFTLSQDGDLHGRTQQFVVDGSDLQGFTITELRLLAKLQEFEEINARFGFRYIEGLRGHFGISPRDSRLDRPEFIGGMTQDIIFPEILQTSESGETPLGTPASRGVSSRKGRISHYTAEEHGLLIGVCSILPEQIYTQGINRQWTRRTKEEFFSPEFNGLSEQEIRTREVYATLEMSEAQLNTVFGFVPAWEELRTPTKMALGSLGDPDKQDIYAWTQARHFTSIPTLNENFVMASESNSNGGIRTDMFDLGTAMPNFVVDMHTEVRALSTVGSGIPGITRI